ncbi:MAG: TatD family hydrolase [Candidatus Marinimicrobia bacterium]|nr:TatD family hydrolase [Candidatus Neomarinimicrobiota bacterium]MCF7923183.1 TatD family hydrolase [Candidatus Neomarinimicrobiota bacterium]
MKFIDTHCHLNIEPLLDRTNEILDAAAEKGIHKMVVVGIDLVTSEIAIRLAEDHPQIFAAVGIHPNDCSKAPKNWEKEIVDMLSHPKVVAVGETGLDYYWDDSPAELQKIFFRDHLDLALATGKPVIIHNREADQDIVQQILEHGNTRGVFHCWPAPWEIAKPLLDKGYHISFTGTVTFKKNEAVQDVATRMPLDHLMLETDSPFLTPVPHRGKRPNEPKYIPHIAEKIAALRGMTVDEIAKTTTNNAEIFFGWNDLS